MSRLRRHPIVRVAVLVLLAWTAIDLLAPEVCAAETPAGASAVSGAAVAANPLAPDDCFCCSHCVDPVTLTLVLGDASLVSMTEAAADNTSPGVARPLFHPPLSL